MDLKYTIQRGDTLSEIAERLGVNMRELAKANDIEDMNKIYAGRSLIVPGKQEQEKVQAVQERIQKEQAPPPAAPREKNKSMADKVVDFFIPSAKADTKAKPSLLSKEPERDEPILPANIRQLIYDVSGGNKPVTEADLKSEELKALKDVVSRARKRNSKAIEYIDYATEGEGESQYADVGGGGSMLGKIADPSYSMKTLIGQARIAKDEKGNTLVIDEYDFNDAVDGSLFDYLKDAYRAGTSFYKQARAVGKHFGSKPGEGSPVVINLGKV